MYLIEKTINKLYSDDYTFFLDPDELYNVTSHLKKNSYYIYKPYPFSEKNIIYINTLPKIILFEIQIPITVRHQDILGTLYSLGIANNLYGDIVIDNNHYYFYTFEKMRFFFLNEFTKIKNTNISLIEKDINYLANYIPMFEEISIITPSLRIDTIIAKIIHTNRDEVKKLIKDKKVIYNYNILKEPSKILKTDDTFSIRKIGKFKFHSITANTKKDNLVIKILKYIDN